MAKYCSECGNPINEDARFCDSCGSPVLTEPEYRTIVDGLPPGITVDENGAYHWHYSLNMIKNPIPLISMIKITAGVCGFLALITALPIAFEGDFMTALKEFMIVFFAIGGGFTIVVALVWLCMAAARGGYYEIDHIMNEKKVVYMMTKKEKRKMKSAAFFTFLVDAASDESTIGDAALMEVPTRFDSDYKAVRSIQAVRKRDLIKVNNILQRNTIYASPEQYDFVYTYIKSHCPNAKIKE